MSVGIFLMGLALYMFATTPHPDRAVSRGGGPVEFVLNDYSGKQIKLSDYRGQLLLANFWATWCLPCRAEMPDLIAFHAQHESEGLQLLAVNTQDEPAQAQAFVRANNMNFPVPVDPQGTVLRALGNGGLPSTFLFDRNGQLVFQWTGQISPAMLEQCVAPLLKQ